MLPCAGAQMPLFSASLLPLLVMLLPALFYFDTLFAITMPLIAADYFSLPLLRYFFARCRRGAARDVAMRENIAICAAARGVRKRAAKGAALCAAALRALSMLPRLCCFFTFFVDDAIALFAITLLPRRCLMALIIAAMLMLPRRCQPLLISPLLRRC